ncbi:MAG: hypothetical protein DSY66_02860 [Persephonella sp.]|nr:MAG: hypothetical protein DSY53_04165 [Persephonella sp.]RUM61117.1 MAG: hypothetical protein DSY66_02860 [Persephonella sp.]
MKKIFNIYLVLLIFSSFTIVNLFSCAPKTTEVKERQTTIKNPKYYYRLGLADLEGGNLSQAIYYLKKAYELDSNDVDILNALGIAYARAGEKEKAKKLFLKAIKLEPRRGETYTNLGVLLASEGKYDEALKYFQKAVSLDEYKNRDKAFFNIALVYKKKGNYNLFEEYLKKTLTFNPYFSQAYILLGEYYLKSKRYIDAYDTYLTALNMGIELPQIYFGLGKAHYYLKNYIKAEYYLKKALNLSKNIVLKQQIEEFLKKVRERKNFSNNEEGKTNIINEQFFIKKPEEPKTLPKPEKYTVPKKPLQEVKPKYRRYFTDETKKRKKIIRYGYKKKSVPKVKFKYYLQVGLFSSYGNALKLYTRLKALGVKPKIVKYKVDGKNYYKVIIGYFKSPSQARKFKYEVLVPKDKYFRRALIKYEKR